MIYEAYLKNTDLNLLREALEEKYPEDKGKLSEDDFDAHRKKNVFDLKIIINNSGRIINLNLADDAIFSVDALTQYCGLTLAEMTISDLPCTLEEAFAYAAWHQANLHRLDLDGIVNAAIYCDVEADCISECYEGLYTGLGDFAKELLEQGYREVLEALPLWVCFDYEAMWRRNLRHSYSEHEGHIFKRH